MASNCKPDAVNDPDYAVVKNWLGMAEINVMLEGKYEFNDKNASLIMLGIAMHIMGDTYSHQSFMYKNGKYVAPETNLGDGTIDCARDSVNNIPARFTCAKESILNLWTNYYNSINTTGADYEVKHKEFRLNKLYTYAMASTNGKSKDWYWFRDLPKFSCKD